MLDVLLLSRLQFSLTIMFHYIFPPISIGLGVLLVFMEGLYLKTKNPVYENMTRFFTKIYGLNFALGVASGIVMEFQFGTNWATFSRYVGDVFGSPLAAEGIFAFFLESTFLGLLLFGWDKVSAKVHFFSTIMVALGSILSALWIIVANSWQQTPAGYKIVGEGLMARAEITDFWAMVFNPSSLTRVEHTLIGAFLMGAFFVMSITAYYILKNRHVDLAKRAFTIALVFGAITSVGSLFSGHHQAKKLAVTQPAKLAAFEGVFQTKPGTPLYMGGIPDAKNEKVHLGLPIPGMLSFLVYGDFKTPIKGLDQIPRDEWPPIGIPFQSYHLMVGLGFAMIGLCLTGVFFLWRKTLFQQTWLLALFVPAVVAPLIANQMGWIASEVGRQPWIVYGLLRTSDALSKVVKAEQVLWSIVMFTMIYVLLLVAYLFVLNKKIQDGPDEGQGGHAS